MNKIYIILIFFISVFFIILIRHKKSISIKNKYEHLVIKKICKNRERYIVKNFLNKKDTNFLIKMNDDYGDPHRTQNIECEITDIDNKYKKRYKDIENRIINMINYISKKNHILDLNLTVHTNKIGIYAHADNAIKKNGKWVPNHTPNRTWTSSLLLSDRKMFKGGHFKFHDPEQTIYDFERGDLLVFKSDQSNPHEVTKIDEGERYVHLTWLHKNNFKNKFRRFLN
jgi:hypothetical protein